jgi:D-alanine-D-alanine ligase
LSYKKKLAIVYGGKSGEHDVSLQTARSVINSVDPSKYECYPIYISRTGQWHNGPRIEGKIERVELLDLTQEESRQELSALSEGLDTPTETREVVITDGFYETKQIYDVVFPLLHGPNGEDGTVQGLLELLDVPYVGAGVLASAVGMDKVLMKTVFAQEGLPQGKYVHVLRTHWEKDPSAFIDKVEVTLGYPCFIKPANLGSSVGISKAKNREQLIKGIDSACQYDRKIIVEEFIEAREIELAILGNEDPMVSVAGEIVPSNEFYDYKAKYIDGKSAMIIPAEISEETYEELKQLAIRAYRSVDGTGLTRADFFLTKDGRIYINEINTMPGFTPFSMYPLLWQNTGVSYSELIDHLIDLALERFEDKKRTRFDFSVEEN